MTIEQPIDQVKVARSATTGADCEFTRNVRISACGERRDLLVAYVDPFDGLLASNCVDDPIE
jgi:hypothetical protein